MSNNKNRIDVLHTNLETDETYISSEKFIFNKTKWHGVAKMKDIYMQSNDGIIYSTKQCKIYLGGHRYMSGFRRTGLSGLQKSRTRRTKRRTLYENLRRRVISEVVSIRIYSL